MFNNKQHNTKTKQDRLTDIQTRQQTAQQAAIQINTKIETAQENMVRLNSILTTKYGTCEPAKLEAMLQQWEAEDESALTKAEEQLAEIEAEIETKNQQIKNIQQAV